jgi:hypothetical protein
MNCEQFEQLAPQIAHNELCDAKLLRDAANHAAQCAACDAILVEARELAAAVASLATQDKLLEVPARMESTLRAAFVRERATDTRSRKNVFVGATFRWAAASLVAATIILAIILLPRILNRKSETNHAVITPTQPASPVVAGTKTAPAPTALVPVTQKRLVAAHKPKKNLAESEITLTGFLALPYADDLSTIEYGAIVRMQMSRADLAWLGLPVAISDNGEKVVADLFVNGSGTPEAIRLVR